MLYSLVDIGSNSVRLNIYDINKGEATFMFSKKETIGLASYIKKEKLSKKGIKKLLEVLEEIRFNLKVLNIKKSKFFATASLRNISNKEEVLKTVKKKLKIDIDVLSGDEEAYLGFLGSINNIDEDEGILIDLGGGSLEIVIFKNRKVKKEFSIPIGSLVLYNDYVSLLIPNKEESKEIKEKVLKELKNNNVKKEKINFICGVGGSIRTIEKILKDLSLLDDYSKTIDVNLLNILKKELSKNDKETYNKILHSKPSRIHTLVPALIVTQEICNYFSCKKLQVSKFGVREGYLNKVLGEFDE